MSFFDFIQLKILSVWYIPQTLPDPSALPAQVAIADYPDLIFLEKFLTLILFLILFIPHLRKLNNRNLEQKRKLTLKVSALVMGGLAFLWILRSGWIF